MEALLSTYNEPDPGATPVNPELGGGAWSGGFGEEEALGVDRNAELPEFLTGTSQPRSPSAPAGRVRSELKTKQQILKQRRRAEKLRFLQRGGLKQLSARNRRRAQELQRGAFGRGTHAKKGKMRKRM